MLKADQVKALIGKFWGLSRTQLQEVAQNPASSMGEIIIASIMAKAAKDGDYSRLSGLLDRAIGKVKDQVDVSVVKPTIIERLDGSRVEMGMIQEDKENE